jgi:hypothetical protein
MRTRVLLLLFATFFFSGCSVLNKPKYAGIQVITTNATSAIFLNDQHINNTPLNEKTIQPGVYNLKIIPEDSSLTQYETSVTLRAGLLTVVTWKPAERPELSGGVIYEMEPLSDRTRSEVSFITIPDGAIITFEGREQLFSPTVLTDVAPGQHEYEISLPSYETQKHTVNAVAGYRMLIRAKLAKTSPAGVVTTEKPESTNASPEATASARVKIATSSATAKQVKILETGYFLNSQEVLRVRDQAGVTGVEAGLAPVGEIFPYLGETRGEWHKILFKEKDGWVSAEFSQLLE